MSNEKSGSLQVRFVPDPNVRYEHVHVFRASRLDEEYVLVGFGLDIASVADTIAAHQAQNSLEVMSPVDARVRGAFVMGSQAFHRLLVNVITLAFKSKMDVAQLVNEAKAVAGGAAPSESDERGAR